MSEEALLIFKEIEPSHPSLSSIIALSIGNPTPEKLRQVLGSYSIPNHHLVGCFKDNELIGMIGLQVQGTKGKIKHIAVLPKYWLQGIGKTLARQVIDTFRLQSIYAETDNGAVGFYKRLGFACQPFEGHHGKRYKCEYK